MESKDNTYAKETEEIRMERAHQHAKKLAKAYREKMFEDLTGAPDHIEKRLLAGSLAMEYLDISTDLFALGVVLAANEASGPSSMMVKVVETLTEGVENFGEASKQFLLIAMRNAIQKKILDAPDAVNEALANVIDGVIKNREKELMERDAGSGK